MHKKKMNLRKQKPAASSPSILPWTKLSKAKSKIFLLILLTIALLYSSRISNNESTENTILPKTTQSTQRFESPTENRYESVKLSASEQKLLEMNLSDNQEEKRNSYSLALEIAKKSDVLDITSCIAKPFVFKVDYGQTLTIKNNDETPHIIHFTQKDKKDDKIYEIPPQGEKKIKIDLEPNSKLGFACDKYYPNGLILIGSDS